MMAGIMFFAIFILALSTSGFIAALLITSFCVLLYMLEQQ